MNKKRIAVIAVLLAVLMLLSGCGMKSQHVQAVEDAIIGYSDYYIEIQNLGAQMRKQARGLTGYEENASYTLDIQIPDYSLIDINNVTYEVPAIDYSNPDSEVYLAKVQEAIRKSVEAYAYSAPFEGYVDAKMTVDLERGEDGWQAEIASASKNDIQTLVDGMMEAKAAELKSLPVEYDYVRVAEQKGKLLGELISGEGYIEAIEVTSVDDLGGGQYRLNLSYPDPAVAFTSLGDEFVSSFHERVFGGVSYTLDPNEYSDSIAAPKKAGSITASMDGSGVCTLVDGQSFADEITQAREAAETAAEDAVNAQWGVPEVAQPTKSQVVAGASSGGAEVRINVTKDAPNTYVRIMKVSDSLDDDGELVVGEFIVSGSRVTLKVAGGNYKMLMSTGNVWYGPEFMFGPSGSYYMYDEMIDLPSGYYISFTCESSWYWYDDVAVADYDVDITQ